MNLTLFPDVVVDCPYTEGIKYTGSKLKLLPYIIQLAQKVHPKTIFDGFSGTTRVAQAFARLGYKIITNDIAVWSKVFFNCYLKARNSDEYYQKMIDHLNSLPGRDDWFTEHYGGEPNGGKSTQKDGFKKLWQIHNTRKLDAIREEIDILNLNEVDKSVLLTSLILALDKVDNTLGHYAAYLTEWAPRSYNLLKMELPNIVRSQQSHNVYNDNIFNILDDVVADLAYYDPPYGSNNDKMPPSRVRYAAYYHIWTTICLNDKPELFGKVGRRADSSDNFASSIFEEYKRSPSGKFVVVEAIEKLIKMSRAKHIILSYSSGGRATAEELKEVLSNSGDIIEIISVDYRKNVMANMRWTNDWVRDTELPNKEYLFLLDKWL